MHLFVSYPMPLKDRIAEIGELLSKFCGPRLDLFISGIHDRGKKYKRTIDEVLRVCDRFILFSTPCDRVTTWCAFECGLFAAVAADDDERELHVLARNDQDVPPPLSEYAKTLLHEGDTTDLHRLLRDLLTTPVRAGVPPLFPDDLSSAQEAVVEDLACRIGELFTPLAENAVHTKTIDIAMRANFTAGQEPGVEFLTASGDLDALGFPAKTRTVEFDAARRQMHKYYSAGNATWINDWVQCLEARTRDALSRTLSDPLLPLMCYVDPDQTFRHRVREAYRPVVDATKLAHREGVLTIKLVPYPQLDLHVNGKIDLIARLSELGRLMLGTVIQPNLAALREFTQNDRRSAEARKSFLVAWYRKINDRIKLQLRPEAQSRGYTRPGSRDAMTSDERKDQLWGVLQRWDDELENKLPKAVKRGDPESARRGLEAMESLAIEWLHLCSDETVDVIKGLQKAKEVGAKAP